MAVGGTLRLRWLGYWQYAPFQIQFTGFSSIIICQLQTFDTLCTIHQRSRAHRALILGLSHLQSVVSNILFGLFVLLDF